VTLFYFETHHIKHQKRKENKGAYSKQEFHTTGCLQRNGVNNPMMPSKKAKRQEIN
jgi:hypothetical protein